MTAAPRQFVIGIDLGGTKVRAGIAHRNGDVVLETQHPTVPGGGEALVGQLAEIVRSLSASVESPVRALGAVGIGGAGVPDDANGGFGSAPNLGDFASFSFTAELERELGCAVVLDNDANVAALGELSAGIGRTHNDFAYVAIGTGIGMGLVLDGALVRGVGNAAGEIGYLPLGTDPVDSANHRRGPLEEAVAGDVLAARLHGATSAHDLFARAADGDADAVAVIDVQAKWLAHAIVAVEAIVAPGRYVLGGGIGSRAELLEPIRAWLDRLGRPGLSVTISELGSAAPVLGAVRLARTAAAATNEGVPA